MRKMRLIDANAAADKIMRDAEKYAHEIGNGAAAIMTAFAGALRNENWFPTIEAEPVRHGRWINDELHGKYVCTCCNKGTWRGFGVFDFCPNCGAKMDGGAEK